MTVDPRLQPLLAGPGVSTDPSLSPAQRREMAHAAADMMRPALFMTPPDVAHVDDHDVAVDGGSITVRCYSASASDTPKPAFVYFHGGGWWMGDLEAPDPFCRRLANRVDCVVFNVDYRLAPEHPYPTPLEDCYAAVRWLHDAADELGVDSARIVIGGESAGGNLAAATALLARERGPQLAGLLLLVPALDLTMSQPSMAEFGEGYGLTLVDITECRDFYVDGADPSDQLLSPLYADLTGLPPTLVVTAEYDPLRDDGDAFVAALDAVGVSASVHRQPGMLHGAVMLNAIVPDACADFDDRACAFLEEVWKV